MSRTHLAFVVCAVLTAGPALYSAPSSIAQAQQRDHWEKEFDKLFEKHSKDIDYKIKNGSTVYDTEIGRMRTDLEYCLRAIKKKNIDSTSYQKRYDDYMGSIKKREAEAKRKKARSKIKTPPRVAPGPGVARIRPKAPTWCNDILERYKKSNNGHGIRSFKTLDLPSTVHQIRVHNKFAAERAKASRVDYVAMIACADPDYKPVQKWAAAYRQSIANLTGMSETQLDELFTFSTTSWKKPKDRPWSSGGGRIPDAPHCQKSFPMLKTGLLEERQVRTLVRDMLGCAGNVLSREGGSDRLKFPANTWPYWLADTPEGPKTEIERAALVYGVLSIAQGPQVMAKPAKTRDSIQLLTNFAMARTIKLDKKALESELKRLPATEEHRWILRFLSYGAHQSLATVDGFTRKVVAGQSHLQNMLYNAPLAAANQDKADADANQSLWQIVHALEDRLRPSKSVDLTGCGEVVYKEFGPWLKTAYKKQRPERFEDLKYNDYKGALLQYALNLCSTGDRSAGGLSRMFMASKGYAPRGRLAAAYNGLLEAFNKHKQAGKGTTKNVFSATRSTGGKAGVKFKRPGFNNIVRPHQPESYWKTGTVFGRGAKTRGRGVVKKAKKKGDRVHITFKTISWKRKLYKCHRTNRIDYIESNGRVEYQQVCKATGRTETVKETAKPITIPAWAAGGVKRGVFMHFSEGDAASSRNKEAAGHQGFPMEVYKSKRKKKLINMAGVKL